MHYVDTYGDPMPTEMFAVECEPDERGICKVCGEPADASPTARLSLRQTYNKIEDVVTRYQQEETSPGRAMSDIAAIIADHESGEDV